MHATIMAGEGRRNLSQHVDLLDWVAGIVNAPRTRTGSSEPGLYIRKTPNVVSGIGAFSAAEMPSASTRRVSSGSMIPSSQSRAVE